MKPRLLIVNDDGIDSPFLPTFAKAMSQIGDVQIVVPAREQSWIGRAYNRHAELELKKRDFLGFNCHSVSGTPADCVNVALTHVLQTRPDAVISGINIGRNVAFPLLWSSGTFSAAVEGAGFGLKAYAFSMELAHEYYEALRLRHTATPDSLSPFLEAACSHAAEFVANTIQTPAAQWEILNVNYPAKFTAQTPFRFCVPAKMKFAPLWRRNERGNFEFKYNMGERETSDTLTDVDALEQKIACWSSIIV